MTAVSEAIEPAAMPDWAQLISDHQADLWRYLRYLGADRAEAEDLLQETFLAVMRSKFVYHSSAQAAGYLRAAARNQLLILRRRERRQPTAVELEAAEDVWAEAFRDGSTSPYQQALAGCLEHLEGRARQAIELHYTHKTSRADIAEQLDMKPEGVKTLLRRTRDVLRDCIERRLEDR